MCNRICALQTLWLPLAMLLMLCSYAPVAAASPLVLDAVDSGEMHYQRSTPLLPFPVPVPPSPTISYRHFDPLNMFEFQKFESAGCLCAFIWEVNGYVVFDTSQVGFPIHSAALQFDLTPGIDVAKLEIHRIDAFTPAFLASLASPFTLPLAQGEALFDDIRSGSLFGSIDLAAGAGVYNAQLSNEAVTLLNASSGLFALGISMAEHPGGIFDIGFNQTPRLVLSAASAVPQPAPLMLILPVLLLLLRRGTRKAWISR